MSNTHAWTAEDVPDLSGQTIIVTGANSGIGYEAARQFARKGARVVLACRNLDKAYAAAAHIAAVAPQEALEVHALDLGDLASVRAFASAFQKRNARLHVLCNNAGVMALPYRRTADGFEAQFGTNHLGHFALTGLLLDRLLTTPGARVVTVSSGAHRFGNIRFADLQWKHGYRKWAAYGQSKLANLLFAFELQRRLEAAHAPVISVACYPGYAATNLQAAGPRMSGSTAAESVMRVMNRLFAQDAAMGALPTIYAATAPVRGGDYIGPNGLGEMWGYPTVAGCSARAKNRALAAKLWDISERLTNVHFEALYDAAS